MRRGFRGRIGIDLGYYWGRPYGYYGPYGHFWYYYPYYPWGFAWSTYHPRYYYADDYGFGAVDLNVRPKKAEVYVDGELVGRTGKFDGFPGHLILESGRYQLVFYHPGYKTVAREVRVPAGVVIRVRLDLEPGEAVPPEKMVAGRIPEDRRPVRVRPGDRDVEPPQRPVRERERVVERQRHEGRDPGAMDVRGDPGRFRIAVQPADASVYLDGRFLGSGDELAKLHSGMLVEPGEHRLEVVRPGYATRSLDFTVEAGGEVELEVELEKG